MESGVFFHRVYNNDVSISGRGSAHDDDGFGEEDCGASFAGRRKFEFVSHLDWRERESFHFCALVVIVVVVFLRYIRTYINLVANIFKKQPPMTILSLIAIRTLSLDRFVF